MDISKNKRIVLAIDTEGTNFVFGAMQGGKSSFESVTLPSNS